MGGHGGINILGQKKWHVYRVDNRLRVERDERRVADREREQRQRQVERNLTEAVQQLTGEEVIAPAEREAVVDVDTIGGYYRKHKDSVNINRVLRDGGKVRVDVDLTADDGEGRRHFNLFAAEEAASKKNAAEHQTRVKYQELNNELAGRSKKRPISEFDEVVKTVPWYMQSKKERSQQESLSLKKVEARELPAANNSLEDLRKRKREREFAEGAKARALVTNELRNRGLMR
jgi:hypothetical protein